MPATRHVGPDAGGAGGGGDPGLADTAQLRAGGDWQETIRQAITGDALMLVPVFSRQPRAGKRRIGAPSSPEGWVNFTIAARMRARASGAFDCIADNTCPVGSAAARRSFAKDGAYGPVSA